MCQPSISVYLFAHLQQLLEINGVGAVVHVDLEYRFGELDVDDRAYIDGVFDVGCTDDPDVERDLILSFFIEEPGAVADNDWITVGIPSLVAFQRFQKLFDAVQSVPFPPFVPFFVCGLEFETPDLPVSVLVDQEIVIEYFDRLFILFFRLHDIYLPNSR